VCLSLSAEATMAGSIYLGRAVAVSMPVLSFRRNSKHCHSSTNASLFSSNKSLLKVPEDTVYRSLKRIEWKDVSVSPIGFDVSLPTWSFIKLDTYHDINIDENAFTDGNYEKIKETPKQLEINIL